MTHLYSTLHNSLVSDIIFNFAYFKYHYLDNPIPGEEANPQVMEQNFVSDKKAEVRKRPPKNHNAPYRSPDKHANNDNQEGNPCVNVCIVINKHTLLYNTNMCTHTCIHAYIYTHTYIHAT